MLSPVLTCTPAAGRRRRAHWVLTGRPEPGRRLQVARPRRPLGSGADSRELFSARGAESGRGERAEGARSPGCHALPQAQVLLAPRL